MDDVFPGMYRRETGDAQHGNVSQQLRSIDRKKQVIQLPAELKQFLDEA